MSHDKYGDPKYAIYVPKSIHGKIKGLLDREVIVIVILPDDESKIICSGEALENFQFITVNGKVIFEDKDSSY